MNASTNLSIYLTSQCVYLRVTGRATMHCSPDFKRAVIELVQKGRNLFVLDLSECQLMDSTFLGVLISFVVKETKVDGRLIKPSIKIYRPNSRILDLFDSLGMMDFIEIINEVDVDGVEFSQVGRPQNALSKMEMSQTSLEAHELLMSINQNNVAKFKDVVQFLAEDIKKMGSA